MSGTITITYQMGDKTVILSCNENGAASIKVGDTPALDTTGNAKVTEKIICTIVDASENVNRLILEIMLDALQAKSKSQ